MSLSRRSGETGRWPGQHYRGCNRGKAAQLNLCLRAAAALVLLHSQISAASLLHIRVLEGEGAIHPAGQKSTRGLLVEITDETGKPVDGAAVSFRLPEEGPGGTFVHGMRTEILITGPDGRAGVREMTAGPATGPFQVRITAARNSVRAGTVVDQYVSQSVQGSKHGSKSLVSSSKEHASKKWILWLAIGGGAAAAGILAGSMGSSSSPGTTAPPVSNLPPPSVGTPSISVGGPK